MIINVKRVLKRYKLVSVPIWAVETAGTRAHYRWLASLGYGAVVFHVLGGWSSDHQPSGIDRLILSKRINRLPWVVYSKKAKYIKKAAQKSG